MMYTETQNQDIIMKTSLLTKAPGIGLGVLFLTVVSSTAVAGPGPQYWQSLGKAKAPAVEPAKPSTAPTHLCPGGMVVPVTVMKPTLPNGRGPLVAVQTGTKTVCRICPVTVTVTANAWPNGRGPLTTMEVTKTGVEHACTNCMAVAKN
jgi:hypothetical protein